MNEFAGWVGGSYTYDEMKRQVKLMASRFNTTQDCKSVYLPGGAMVAPHHPSSQILQNGTASILLLGEIFLNHKQLQKPYRLSLEEILEAYLNQGSQCLNSFHGQFALAILVAQHEELFLACDRFGSYPLFYAHDNDHMVFSTHMSPLLQHGVISASLNEQAVYNYLYHHFIPSPQTIYQGIHRVEAGHYILHRRNKTLSIPYWQPASFPKRSTTFNVSKNKLLHYLRRSISKYEQPNIGAFLSGGLDSSTVVGLMSELYGQNISAFTIGFDQEIFDESSYAQEVAQHFKVTHHHKTLHAEDLLQALPDLIESMDQPFGNASLVGAYFCAELAKSKGVQCLLAGDGGDELFGGNSRYQMQFWFQKYRSVPKVLQKSLVEWWLHAWPEPLCPRFIQKARKFVTSAKMTLPERESYFNLLNHLQAKNILCQDFLREVEVNEPMQALQQSYRLAQGKSWLNKLQCMDMKWILADNDLLKVRTAAHCHQVQVHFPMLDEHLIDFALKLPEHYKVSRHGLRPFYKKAMQHWLPKSVIQKHKHGFGVPFGHWVLQSNPLKEQVFETLNQLKKRNIAQPAFIDQLKNDLLVEHPGYYGVMAWVLFVLESWLHTHQKALYTTTKDFQWLEETTL